MHYSRPLPVLAVAFQYRLINCPGKSTIGMIVDFGPNASTPPHRHGGASVLTYGLEGTLLNKMNDESTQVIPTGGSWHEAPGCHHKISDNHSPTEPAKLLAVFVVNTKVVEEGGVAALIQIDEEYQDIQLGG